MTATTDLAPAPRDPEGELAPPRKRKQLTKLVGMTVALGAVLAILLAIFILPSLKSGPTDLPVGLVGSSQEADRFEEALTASAPGAYAVQEFADQATLIDAVRGREVVGGFVVGPNGVHSVVASAGGGAIAQSVSATAQAIGTAMGVPVTTDDVVALPTTDPSGIGIGGLAFPLVFGGIVPAVAFRTIFPRNNGWKLAGILTFSVVGGLVVSTVLRFVFGSIETSFWPVTGAMALGIAALAMPLAGLQEALGSKGFTLSAMVMMFLGNPLAGIATTSAWLPPVLGTFGQLLPPGAAGTLVRSAAYFDGAGGLTAALTLVTWFVLGLVVHTIGVRRKARAAA